MTEAPSISVVVNDKPMTFPTGTQVSAIVDALKMSGLPLAVEINYEIVSFDQIDDVTVSDGDRLEVVTLAGGG